MKRDGGLSHCEISTPLHVQTLRLHICWWHIAEHAHLVLFIMSRHCNPLLLQPLSWREGENKEADQIFPSWFNWISTFSGNLWLPVHKKDQGLGHVDIASLLALIRPLYELLTRSQRPGDAETSSTFRFNPPRVILSLETHAPAAALLFMFHSPTRPPKPDVFLGQFLWIKAAALLSFHEIFLLTGSAPRFLLPPQPTHKTDLMNPVVFCPPMMQREGNSLGKGEALNDASSMAKRLDEEN